MNMVVTVMTMSISEKCRLLQSEIIFALCQDDMTFKANCDCLTNLETVLYS